MRGAQAQFKWSRDWLLLPQEELYGRCRAMTGNDCDGGVPSLFLSDSIPYLMATEHPWTSLVEEDLRCRSVLTIAGSGDLPFFFSSLGTEQLVAIDISRPACTLNELKQAALQHFEWKDFLPFFLADIERASSFLKEIGLPESLAPRERQQLYHQLRPGLSRTASAFWDVHFSGKEGEPPSFERFVRPSALFCLQEIPYLKDADCYAAWRAAFKPYTLLNLPLDVALASCDARMDVLYLSNVLEYSRNSFLLEENESGYRQYLAALFRNAARILEPSGVLFIYAFESAQSSTFQSFIKDLEPLKSFGFNLSTQSIHYSSPLLPDSVFRNTLLRFQR
jgi:hypothetical protein